MKQTQFLLARKVLEKVRAKRSAVAGQLWLHLRRVLMREERQPVYVALHEGVRGCALEKVLGRGAILNLAPFEEPP